MPNFPGETFVSNGFKYILRIGPKGSLRPYYLGPVIAAGGPYVWIGLAIVVVGALVVVALCANNEDGTETAGTPS